MPHNVHWCAGRYSLSKLEYHVDVRQTIEDGEEDRGWLLYAEETDEWPLESQDINKMTEAGFKCMLLIGNWNHKTLTR